jgi:hypothetical protein
VTKYPQTLRALRGLETAIRAAITEARAGYQFAPNSYTFAAMQSCSAAEPAIDVLRAALEAETER